MRKNILTRFSLNLVLYSAIIFMFSCRKPLEIDFFKEDVTIEIKDKGAEVTGIYCFKNLTSNRKRVKFFYPFPVDSNHVYPDTIIAAPFEKDTAGIYFSLVFNPQEEKSIKIFYTQRVEYQYFVYITTTTQKWKRPIKEANFTIVAADILLLKINYSVFDQKKKGNKNYYYIKVKNFFPQEDLEIEW